MMGAIAALLEIPSRPLHDLQSRNSQELPVARGTLVCDEVLVRAVLQRSKAEASMENLLPAVANIDVTSDEFRETTLPYQQWEAKRTHYVPSTPSDICHLLPPISTSRTPRARHDGAAPPTSPLPREDSSPPRPAPVDQNLSVLYDPALDPSPIGMEERGVTQPIRITRIVPRRERTIHIQIYGKNQPGEGCATGTGAATFVTIVNGYRQARALKPFLGDDKKKYNFPYQDKRFSWTTEIGQQQQQQGGHEDDIDIRRRDKRHSGIAVDVFVKGLSTGIGHATLFPSECFRRALQQSESAVRPPLPSPPDATLTGVLGRENNSRATMVEDDRDVSLGLTIFLSGAGDWCNCDDGRRHDDRRGGDGSGGAAAAPPANDKSAPGPEQSSTALVSQRETATRLLFQRHAMDGRLAPPVNAFRVQFEPGPLGMELEEDLQRGVVQIRRVLQAGQAEQDGRLSDGFLLIAVGDSERNRQPTSSLSPVEADSSTICREHSTERTDEGNVASENPALVAIRSLAELEKALLYRDPNRLFEVWVLDRFAPEAIAALGEPAPTSPLAGAGNLSFAISKPCGRLSWSLQNACSPSLQSVAAATTHNGLKHHGGPSETTGCGQMRGDRGRGSNGEELFEGSISSTIDVPANDCCLNNGVGASGSDEEEPGWEVWKWGRPDTKSDYHRGEHTYLRRDGVGREATGGGTQARPYNGDIQPNVLARGSAIRDISVESQQPSSVLAPPAVRGLPDTPPTETHSMGYSVGGDSEQSAWQPFQGSCLAGLASPTGVAEGGWEFETGRGMFDEYDQGLAARRKPRGGGMNTIALEAGAAEEDERPELPMGLHASTSDDFAVFIWFCNSHQSAVMQVSWMDYDGRLVPRRALAPGACYFERSFASHPWVLQHHAADNDCVGDGDCCVVRLGNAMASARFTGALLWNPSTTAVSLMRQAKIGVAGPGADGLSEVGNTVAEGAGVSPGNKRLCFAGAEREAEAARSAAGRARVRSEKLRILDEMRASRTYPPGGLDIKGVRDVEKIEQGDSAGFDAGAPNLRVVMVGSTRPTGYTRAPR